ncbi:MAG TPA: acyloxyacyl hydrolase [Steroidobacteraceae bacterium]|nr:acyloxyacyl hydrolase [Steroidobacteraceae bacterium]
MNDAVAPVSEDGLTPFRPCPLCQLFVGIGGTYQFWGWSDGIVVPFTLELNESRWEVGGFRMARRQIAMGYGPPDKVAAEPYWAASVMRRWQFLHRPWGRLYFGFGAVYRTETDYLDPTRWDFAYLLAARFDVEAGLLEVAVRHWSDAWIKQPNRGQDFVTVSVSF